MDSAEAMEGSDGVEGFILDTGVSIDVYRYRKNI